MNCTWHFRLRATDPLHRRRVATTSNRFVVAALLSFVLCAPLPAAHAGTAIEAIAKQYDRYPLIMLGEWHRNVQQHVFLRDLIRDPAFICRTDDIVIEFGNSRLQSVADAYASGENVTEAQLQSMFRETAVPFTWNSPVYRQFYETVRDVNAKHICPHPVRLVLGDPPIDWSRIKTLKDFEPFGDRDRSFADIVEREVLAKHRHALLISGEPHALRKLPKPDANGDGLPEPTVAQLIEREHPGVLFSIALVTTSAAAKVFKMDPPPSFKVVRGSALERADFGLIAPAWTATPIVVNGKHDWKLDPAKSWPRMGEVVDGLLYLGGDETRIFPPPSIYLDPVYQQALRERSAIIKEFNGQDFTPMLDDLVKEAQQAKAPSAH